MRSVELGDDLNLGGRGGAGGDKEEQNREEKGGHEKIWWEF